jgi:hypothetical protein
MFRTTEMGIRNHVYTTRNNSITGATVERVRIARNGMVHAYGAFPNCNHRRGWWLVGHKQDILAEIHAAAREADAMNEAG